MTVAAILSARPHDVIAIAGDARATEAIALLAEKRIGALPVLDGERVVGVFSERDVLYCLASEGAAVLNRGVRELMTSPAVTVTRDQSVLGALALMTQRRIRHLPVVEGDRLVGLVSIGDLVKYRIDRIEAEAEAMRSYIQQV
ncbi:CBS domain-containing protein [Sphingomonas baiyangensis]|uniref:CBS domain-containing protein n=1 Tax=Sphingomonas baiyangensis TaxID=2572576 RepID=A0A4U1L4Z3_9SPHN|nr:CBS domain-containing protein [Sphingomonas baiyangensis]TKD51852.1 CBS domain-containing protein [Sphingomonas baiyangensis]